MTYEEDDLAYHYSNDEDDGYYEALGSSCSGGYDDFPYENNDIMPNFDGNIDGEMLRELIHQLANDPRYQHLKEYLTEGLFFI